MLRNCSVNTGHSISIAASCAASCSCCLHGNPVKSCGALLVCVRAAARANQLAVLWRQGTPRCLQCRSAVFRSHLQHAFVALNLRVKLLGAIHPSTHRLAFFNPDVSSATTHNALQCAWHLHAFLALASVVHHQANSGLIDHVLFSDGLQAHVHIHGLFTAIDNLLFRLCLLPCTQAQDDVHWAVQHRAHETLVLCLGLVPVRQARVAAFRNVNAAADAFPFMRTAVDNQHLHACSGKFLNRLNVTIWRN